jgi:hypothetical protein
MEDKFEFPDEIEEKQQLSDDSSDTTVDEDAVEVEIVDDTPERDKGRKPLGREVEDPTEEEIESYTGNVQKRIKELTHARHDERRAKEALLREKQELERLAQHMVEENRKLKEYVNTGTEHYAVSIKQVADSEVDKARRALREANEAYDTDAIIAAQEALLEAKLKLKAAENFRPTPLQVDEYQVQTNQNVSEPQQVDDKTLRWQAKNQWFGAPGYEEMTSFALGLHQKLVNSGVDPRSDEYFERINARMKSTFHDFFGDEDKPKSGDGSRKPSTVVAPATRSTGARKVQLTPTQVALAKKFGLTPQQYAVELAKMEKSNG